MSDFVEIIKTLSSHDNEAARESIKFLYEGLTILDRKADALMAFDGILIAAAAFAMEKGGVVPTHKWRRRGALTVILLALSAAAACLLVARVKYDFLDNVKNVGGKLQLDGELEALATVLMNRTLDYQIAWWLSVIAVGLSALIAVSIFLIPIKLEKAPKRL